MKIPVANPGAAYARLAAPIDAAVLGVLRSGWYILGEACQRFESEFAGFCGAAHCVGVANGTDAVELALRAVGVGAGDRVATVANTAVATVAAIDRIGALPVFCDVEPHTQTMDPAALRLLLASAPDIKAVVPVHLFGEPADLDGILRLAEAAGIPLVEDCAQAHGARVGGHVAGTIGRAGAFSFYPTKNLGALGDGGAVVTGDDAVADRLRLLRQYGWRERYLSEIAGMNSRLDEVQAAVLSVKLRDLPWANDRRRTLAAAYCRGLAGLPLELPPSRPGVTPVFHQFVVRTERRATLARHLAAAGIGTAVLYPVPIHRQPAYAARAGSCALPVTETLAETLLCLPMYPELTDGQADTVCREIRRFFNGHPE